MPAVLTPLHRTGVSRDLSGWIDAVAELARPSIIHWCTGTADESARLRELLQRDGTLTSLHHSRHPKSFVIRTQPNRIEASRTLLCSRSESEAGPSNCWADPTYMQDVVHRMFDGCMRGRVMYVVPYLLGPAQSPLSQGGVQITDSALSAYLMSHVARIGRVATEQIQSRGTFFKSLHSLGTLDPEQRLACLFPEDRLAISHGSNHIDDLLAPRHWHGLKQASIDGYRKNWFAEHMSIVGVTTPDGITMYLGVCGPTGSGKSTLASLIPPDLDLHAGWKVKLVSDDISWLHWQPNGQLHAINPEIGMVGLQAGIHSAKTANLFQTTGERAIFTNLGITLDRQVWWDGADGTPPTVCTDWRGREWTPAARTSASHPESRFIAPLTQYPALSEEWDNPVGVPLSAILFCGRRSSTIPLVHEAFNWRQGVYIGATLSSEPFDGDSKKPAAPVFEPMGMRHGCGYHLADYWQHWLDQEQRPDAELPRIYHVNWFRRDWDGHLSWPGHRENFTVLKWIVDRLRGRGDALRTPLGVMPTVDVLGLHQSKSSRETARTLLEVNFDDWYKELDQREEFLVRFSTKLPPELLEENENLRRRIRHARNQTSSRTTERNAPGTTNRSTRPLS